MKSKKKIELRATKMVSYVVDYNDLETFIDNVYGKHFSFTEDQESGNDSSHEFSVSKEKLDKYEQKKLEEFVNDGDYCFSTSLIMNDLCNKGLIKPGHYIIRVCW